MSAPIEQRILTLGSASCGVSRLVEGLTGYELGSSVTDVADSTHHWIVRNKYYSARIPIWIDEVEELRAWRDAFLTDEAGEVVRAIGAWVYCFSPPPVTSLIDIETMMKAILEVVERHHGAPSPDLVMLAVAMPPSGLQGDNKLMTPLDMYTFDSLEDLSMGMGFEFIDYSAKGSNVHGEKSGSDRILESLESHAWTRQCDDGEVDLDVDFVTFMEHEQDAFRGDNEWRTGLLDANAATRHDSHHHMEPADGVDGTIEDHAGELARLEQALTTLTAVKEQSRILPTLERKKLAARAVRMVMQDL